MQLALKSLSQRKIINRVSSIFLLSDGEVRINFYLISN